MLTAACLMLLASCSKENLKTPPAGTTYQFETAIGGLKNTKGMPKEAWKMGDVIALYGLDMPVFNLNQFPQKWTFAQSQNAQGNLTPMLCYNPAAQDWRYGAPVAWYDGVNTSFIAIHPYDAPEYTLNENPGMASDIVVDYSVQGGYDPAVATEADIVSARSLIKKQTDLLVALTKDLDNTTLSIPLNFRHALSQIRFKITNGAASNLAILRVNDITINGVHTKGEFRFSGNEDAAALSLAQWSNQSTPRSFKVNLLNEQVNAIKFGNTVDATDNDDEALIMLPQAIPSTATISVRYSYSIDEGSTWVEYVQGTQFDPIVLSDIKEHWEPNKRYTFTLTIRPASPITFVPTVDTWGADSDVTLP